MVWLVPIIHLCSISLSISIHNTVSIDLYIVIREKLHKNVDFVENVEEKFVSVFFHPLPHLPHISSVCFNISWGFVYMCLTLCDLCKFIYVFRELERSIFSTHLLKYIRNIIFVYRNKVSLLKCGFTQYVTETTAFRSIHSELRRSAHKIL